MPEPPLLLTTPPKPQAKRRTKKKEKLIPPPEGEVLDEDAVLKTFFTQNAEDFVGIAMPDLHAAVNWLVPIEFCEQEFINFLRGRLRQIDKRKVADKLLRLKLLDGKDVFIFFHTEFQNDLPDELAFRWFKSRMLISLRYNTEDITTLIFFTGKAPTKKHSFYVRRCFGTRTTFKPNVFVIITQNTKKLIAMNNPVGLALLAAKYAAQSKDDMKKRLRLKKKVLDLVEKKGFPLEKMANLITFVFDYMLLPQEMEEALKLTVPFFQLLKSDTNMVLSKNFIDVRDAMSLNETGMNYANLVAFKNAEIRVAKEAAEAAQVKTKEAEAAAEAAQAKAKEAEAAAEAAKEATKEATKEANIKSVHGMLKQTTFSIEKIADVLGLDIDYAKELALIEPK